MMVCMTIDKEPRPGVGDAWPVARAKSRFSELVDRALAVGPQTVTRRGRRTVVVVSAEDWDRKGSRQGTLADFFAHSPLPGSGVRIERAADPPRHSGL